MRTNGKSINPTPPPPAHNRIFLKSQGRVNNTGVTRITICCRLDYYMIESCHNGFKVMDIHMSIFLFSGLLQFAVNKFFMFR